MAFCTNVSGRVFGAVIKQLQIEFPSLREVGGQYWTRWEVDGQELASVCASPLPGPEYGTVYRIRSDLMAHRDVHVYKSRDLTHTEAHILNNRLARNKDLDVALLVEVEDLYQTLKEQYTHTKPPVLGKSSYTFYHDSLVRIREGVVHG